MHDDVRLDRVTKTYGSVRALVAVSVRFPPGEVTVVLGANGSGKSTLLSIVATLTRATSGSVSHGSLGRDPAAVRRRLGWVGHSSLCYPDLTGRENIALAAQLYGVAPLEAVRFAADRFELAGFFDRPFREYSRGQRQRVALARALVHDPRLLLLDEPTTGLDRAGAVRLLDVVRHEARAGATVVVVSHDEAFAGAISSNHIRLERGRLV